MSFSRPTSLADAFLTAACKMPRTKVDHVRGTGNWVARRTLINAERPGFAVIREFDRSPPKPRKSLSKAEQKGLVEGLEQVFLAAAITDVPY